jgi:PAS domain S-box-containing protein
LEEVVSKLFEALNDAADGAFVVDENLRIIYWNEAAEELLKYDWGDVAGLPCYRILLGYDEKKRLICKKNCQVLELAMKSKPVPNYDVQMHTKLGHKRWLNMSVFTYQMNGKVDDKVIVHLFRDINEKKEDEIFLHRLLEAAKQYHSIPPDSVTEPKTLLKDLTQREHEILTLMAQGYGTREIAQELSISTNTVRNHIQHILEKLQVHSRLEAVAFAIKYNMVG